MTFGGSNRLLKLTKTVIQLIGAYRQDRTWRSKIAVAAILVTSAISVNPAARFLVDTVNSWRNGELDYYEHQRQELVAMLTVHGALQFFRVVQYFAPFPQVNNIAAPQQTETDEVRELLNSLEERSRQLDNTIPRFNYPNDISQLNITALNQHSQDFLTFRDLNDEFRFDLQSAIERFRRTIASLPSSLPPPIDLPIEDFQGTIDPSELDVCTICLEGNATHLTGCLHPTHEGCINQWGAVKRVCPSCVRPLTKLYKLKKDDFKQMD